MSRPPGSLALTPYCHPTTVTFVDDNQAFLDSLELEVPRSWAIKLFTEPEDALAYLKKPAELPPLMDRCFSMQRGASEAEALIRLDLDLIEQEINHVGRFRRNSVAVIDYSMPSMDGIEFCAALDDPHLRIALLTGVADEKLAVEAFNAGLIHRFIHKHRDNAPAIIFDHVDEMQQTYFAQCTARLKSALALDPPAFLMEPAVAEFVSALQTERGLIEYYLASDPPGLLMLERNGRIWRLVIHEVSELKALSERARGNGAPAAIVSGLRGGELLPLLTGDPPEDHVHGGAYPWSDKIRPTQALTGELGSYRLALFEDVPGDIDFDPQTASYDAYLAAR